MQFKEYGLAESADYQQAGMNTIAMTRHQGRYHSNVIIWTCSHVVFIDPDKKHIQLPFDSRPRRDVSAFHSFTHDNSPTRALAAHITPI